MHHRCILMFIRFLLEILIRVFLVMIFIFIFELNLRRLPILSHLGFLCNHKPPNRHFNRNLLQEAN
jgi:hypothetical protein